ncbi:MAG: D-alanyl-D-alanine carboxypeptidase [Clostridia bacterium]|nr:D-alanyl-D-alanine carboxypeptidase [Clostridia bacterium]
MINKKRRFAVIVATLFIILASILSVIPAVAVEAPEVNGGEAIVLYDKTHKRYIVEENGFAMLNTSTSAKIMMGLIACETLSDRLDQTVTITEEMISGASGYSMSLKIGEKIKIEDLLYGAICGSYNDAAYALAHICGGSGFVDIMNDRALELGAKSTTYVNPIGYPDSSSMITTAYDTLKIALTASDNELYMSICSAVRHTVKATNKSDERTIYNRNYLVCSATNGSYYNAKCKGLNAGYSGEAGGWSIVTLIEDDGAEYICVLLGGKENADGSEVYAYDSVNTLANWVCKTYDDYTIFPAGAQVGTTNIGLVGVTTNDAPYVTAGDLTVYVPAGCEVSYHIEIDNDLKAPIEAGTVIGKVIATADGDKVGEVELLLKNSYESNSIMVVIDKIGSYTMSRAFVATIICFVVLLAAVLIYRYVNRYNSRGKYTRRR